jgi:hypothetical protein
MSSLMLFARRVELGSDGESKGEEMVRRSQSTCDPASLKWRTAILPREATLQSERAPI